MSIGLLQKKGHSKKSFIHNKILTGQDYACEVCKSCVLETLTRHHKVRQSVKVDNATGRVVSLCREDHDVVERFYDWILPCNVPDLWRERKILCRMMGRIGGLIGALQNTNTSQPKASSYDGLPVTPTFYKQNRQQKVQILSLLKKSYNLQFQFLEGEINRRLLVLIDWDDLYRNAAQYAKKKRVATKR